MQSSSVDNVDAEGPLSHLHHPKDTSTTEPQNEEHGGAMTSSDIVMEENPAYQPLEIATAHLRTGTMESAYYNII